VLSAVPPPPPPPLSLFPPQTKCDSGWQTDPTILKPLFSASPSLPLWTPRGQGLYYSEACSVILKRTELSLGLTQARSRYQVSTNPYKVVGG